MVVGLVHSGVHHHGRGGGGRMVHASPTCPRDAPLGGVRKSRTHDEKNHQRTSSTLFPRTSTMTMTPSTRTTSTLAGIVRVVAALNMADEDNFLNMSDKKLKNTRRNKQQLSSQYSRRSSKNESSSRTHSRASHATSIRNDRNGPNSPPHPFDEDASTLLKTSACSTRSSPRGPEQGDLMNMAYSYSLMEEDSITGGGNGGADYDDGNEYASDEEDDEDGIEITSPPRLLVSSLARSPISGPPVFMTLSQHPNYYSAAQQQPPNSGLAKEDVQELVRAIHDISDCVNSLKNAVLPEAHHIMKDVDTSLRGASSHGGSGGRGDRGSGRGGRRGADRRDRGDYGASSVSTGSNLSLMKNDNTIHGMNHHEKEARQSCSFSSSSNTDGSTRSSNNSNSTVMTPSSSSSSSSSWRSFPEFVMQPEETSALGTSATTGTRRRFRSLSTMNKPRAIAAGENCRRTASLVDTLSKASASVEFLAKTLQKQFNSNNGNINNSNNKQSPLCEERPELQQGDEDNEQLPDNDNGEDDGLEIFQEQMPTMNKPEDQHYEKARNNGAAADSTSAGSSSLIDDSLSRTSSKTANNVNTRATSNGRQQQQLQRAGSGASSSRRGGGGGLAYHSFRPDGDERSHGRSGGGMSTYYGMGSSSGKRTSHAMPCCSTTCLPMFDFSTDYVESFTNLKEHRSGATGVNMDFPREGRPTTSNTGGNPSGRGGGGRRGFVSNHHHHPNPVSQRSSYSDVSQEHWLQSTFCHDVYYDDEDEEDDINLFGHGYYIKKAPMKRSSSLYPTYTAATSCRRTPKETMNPTSFRPRSPATNLGRAHTGQEEHDDGDDDDKGLSSGRRGLDPAVVLQETLDNYHHSSVRRQSSF